MRVHIINIHSSELLCIKIKEFRIKENKNILIIDNLHFLPNNILIKLFKEFIYIYIYIYKNDYQ